ncbi:MAG: PEPxxWA-CTERM sorting domain-containing protein [Parasphingorhabdus sp.]|uniref:PEPxxWA-CTERM sorting domain-containing protein n=1 Tax=Parasphingorhabdus sp. TaxID=2709688 RepID=UPI0032986C20
MSDNLSGLIASANRRRRAAIIIFGSAIGLASVFPYNDRAMWVPETETPFVFTAVAEKLPVTYLTIGGADELLNRFLNFGNGDPQRRLRSRFIPSDPRNVAPQTGDGNTPTAAVPQFGELPTELADAQTVPGSILNPGSGGSGIAPRNNPGNPGGVGGGSGGGSPGTLNNPDPVIDPPVEEPPVSDPPADPPIISPVPEPMTWAMFIFGFTMIGSVLRRRRRKNSAI